MKSNGPGWRVVLRGVAFWCLVLGGAVLVVLGYVGIVMPDIVSLFVLGWLLFVLGVVALAGALRYAVAKAAREHRRSAAATAALVTCVIFVLLSPCLLRKRTVPLVSDGRVVAVAKRPFPWGENAFGVYVGKSKIFSLWGDAFGSPLFIYPFADGQRFLCIDDDDTSVLVFIVDFSAAGANVTNSPGWPPNDYTRKYLAERAPHVVMETKGSIRLPSYAEVQEASRSLMKLTPTQLETASFPSCDLGLYRFYVPIDFLLRQLDTNRQSCWPL